MKKTSRLLIWLTVTSASLCANSHGTQTAEIDRVLAAVNGKVITESDVRVARDLNSLLVFGQGSGRGGLSLPDELNRMVDLELIRQELENFPIASEDQTSMETQMEELRQGYAEIGGLVTIMRRLGLLEDELRSNIRLRASTLRFVNLRFRPFVTVTEAEIQTYYREELTPPLKKAGAPAPALGEVSSQVAQLLAEQKVSAALEKWIQDVRSHSHIEVFSRADAPSASAAPTGAGSPSASGRKPL